MGSNVLGVNRDSFANEPDPTAVPSDMSALIKPMVAVEATATPVSTKDNCTIRA